MTPPNNNNNNNTDGSGVLQSQS